MDSSDQDHFDKARLLSHITCGSYNAVFKILFADGTLWVLKIPANGHRQCWNAPASEALTSEAFTMRLIRRGTTIPVPEVFAFDASLENELGCPFILMEHVHGKLLQDVWSDQEISHAKREQIRIRSLHGIAEAMAQLNSLAFSQGGSLVFDAKGDVAGIGSSNIVDLEAQYANMRSADYDNTMAFRQNGPFKDPKAYLLSFLDARKEKGERGIVEQGAYKLLRLLIEWSLMDASTVEEKKPFVLAHPDLDSQNILVNDDGSLAGIIDWDWIAAVPHSIGPQSLPKFLIQDYDPGNYAFDVEAGEPMEGCVADSPAELASYRAIYAQFMESHLSNNDRMNLAKSRRHAARVRKSRKEAADITRRSLITTTLHLAARAPSEMQKLMVHLFDEIVEITAAQWQEESSTADSGEQDGSEGGNKDGDTEASDVDNSDGVGKELCVHNARSEGKAVDIKHLSIDELMDEIEKLMDMSSAGNPNLDSTEDSAHLQDTSPVGENAPEPGIEFQGMCRVEYAKEAPSPRAARVCGWLKEKLQRGAKSPHKKTRKEDLVTCTALPPSSGPARAARMFCGWTEKKLRRLSHCLHCDDDDNDQDKIGSKIEAVQNGGIDVLKRLQTKLKQLRQKLHRKGNNNSTGSEGGEEEASRRKQVTSVSKELTTAEKRTVCEKFSHVVRDNKLCLTVDQQVAVAQWIIQMLQSPDFSDLSLGPTHGPADGMAERHEGGEHGGDFDLGNDSGYEEGDEDGGGSGTDGQGGDEGIGRLGLQDGEENNIVPIDQACRSLSGESDHLATETAETNFDEEESSEVSQAAGSPKPDNSEQVDTGSFDLLDVCIALAKDGLDEPRMQRLRDGFFGLLNQTL
ncbi:hypothetical protein HO133_005577 [Letharia lupina]|uniref:Aminoglycoside phosphotransferase domain-containing protein n=1 Tax=Letharia lupina TaxID=560253 RepID=A0A8H6F8W1_9LECA|nr:uncharacterized protein HO133_005577 [Letharia lupina]KAF6219033.1 hypothetical protein HO133_005577 [Letharia lupina]